MSRKIDFAQEAFDEELAQEVTPLLRQHYEEIAHFKDIELDPDFEKYMLHEKLGSIRVFTARDHESGELVGYCALFVVHNLHYQKSLNALQDVLFITPERRGFGSRFIDWCDEQLRQEGVQVTYQHVKASHNFGPLLERLGYEHVDQIYARRLD